MGIAEQEEILRQCDRLMELLEQEKRHVPDFLQGDLQEAYSKLLDLEINRFRGLKRYFTT